MRGGVFITLEGGEGAGKSSLAAALAQSVAESGRETLKTREPGGAPGAEALRDLLISGAGDRWDAREEALIFAAARRNHWRLTIAPALTRNAVVICDRFIDSTRAYQRALGRDVDALNALAAGEGDWTPDRTLILDLAPETGLARAAGRGEGETRFEARALAEHAAIRARFLEIAAAEPARCRVIDATATPAAVIAAAQAAIADLLAPA